eukprot:Gb_36525 [translate_table: standard]
MRISASSRSQNIFLNNKRYVSFPHKFNTHMGFENGNCNQQISTSQEEGVLKISDEEKWVGEHAPKRQKHATLISLQKRPVQFDCTDIGPSSPAEVFSFNFPNQPQTNSENANLFLSENSQHHGNWQQRMKLKGELPFSDSNQSTPSAHDMPMIRHCKNAKASKLKSLKITSRKSRAGNTNSQMSAGKEIVQERHFSNLDGCNKKTPSKEMGDMGGALHLLIDAIQLLEEEELHKSITLQAQKKVFIPVLEKNVVREATNTLGRPSLENHQSLVDSDLGAATNLASAEVDQQGKCQSSSERISNCGDMDRVKPLGRSKCGRLQALPAKYSDSVLQPWKKCARKVPTCASS